MQRGLEEFAYHVDLRVWTLLTAVIAVATALALLVGHAQPVTTLQYE